MSKCDCVVCRNNHEFENHPDLISDFATGRVTIFAGSGISTESRDVLKFTLYDDVAAELNIAGSHSSFPDLMEQYSAQPNGRLKLLEVRDRLEHTSRTEYTGYNSGRKRDRFF